MRGKDLCEGSEPTDLSFEKDWVRVKVKYQEGVRDWIYLEPYGFLSQEPFEKKEEYEQKNHRSKLEHESHGRHTNI